MTLLTEYKYPRWLHSNQEKSYLESKGFRAVESSNVSAVGRGGDDLFVRFHNGSVYKYFQMGDELMSIYGSVSKGKWVWRFLRRAGVPYQLVGSLGLPDDLEMTDEEMFMKDDERHFEEMFAYVAITKRVVKTKYGKMEEITVGNKKMYRQI